MTEVCRARNGATQAPRLTYETEASARVSGRAGRNQRCRSQSSLSVDCIVLTNAEACDRDSAAEPAANENDTRRDPGRTPLTRRSMKCSEGFSWTFANWHTNGSFGVPANTPVDSAPSRSGFLATPTDASPRQTFSAKLSIPGEEMPGTARTLARILRGHRKTAGNELQSGEECISNPSRSGQGSATRSCRRKSPPGSEAVRQGESPNASDHAE